MQQAGATLGCDPGLLAGVAPLVSWSAALALTGSVVAVPVLESTGSAVETHGLGALRPVGSSQTRGRTHVSCTGRWSLNHGAARGGPEPRFFRTCLAMPRACCSAGQACWDEEPEAPSAQWEGRFLIPQSITDVCPGHRDGWQ